MKRTRPDWMLLWPADGNGPAAWALYWRPDRRCPRYCEYRGGKHGQWGHVVYEPFGRRHRPVPLMVWRPSILLAAIGQYADD